MSESPLDWVWREPDIKPGDKLVLAIIVDQWPATFEQIADASGLPIENVAERVGELCRRGLCCRSARGTINAMQRGRYLFPGVADDSPIDAKSDWEEFRATWNAHAAEHGWRQCVQSNAERLRKFRIRMKDQWWRDNYRKALECMSRNDFYSTSMRATIDWFMRPLTVTKVIEAQENDGLQDVKRSDRRRDRGSATARRAHERTETASADD